MDDTFKHEAIPPYLQPDVGGAMYFGSGKLTPSFKPYKGRIAGVQLYNRWLEEDEIHDSRRQVLAELNMAGKPGGFSIRKVSSSNVSLVSRI